MFQPYKVKILTADRTEQATWFSKTLQFPLSTFTLNLPPLLEL